jgi:L-ascorbate metabolism protein UlaG (beta-lactamase superfamily)
MKNYRRSPRWSRRTILTATGFSGLAAILYGIYPAFWNRTLEDIQRPVTPAPKIPDPNRWPDTGLHAAWLGHSTVLLKCDGFTILTDPIFSDRAGISLGPVTVGVKRLVAPALHILDLPKVDLILLSHAHMDHFDIPSLRRLENRRTRVVTAGGTTDLLRPDRYAGVRELRWGDTARLNAGRVRAFEVNHWGSRLRRDTWRGYNGYLIEVGRYRLLFAGDTALTPEFHNLHSSRCIDLAIMPIGCYNPWRKNHCTPEEAWSMGNDAGADYFIPVHHRTFTLSSEPQWEPLARFVASAGNETERLGIREIGQELHL